jgi:hypothetical protein
MKHDLPPQLIILISHWSLFQRADITSEAGMRCQFELIRDAGFHAYAGKASFPGIENLLNEFNFKFAAGFDAGSPEAIDKNIKDNLKLGNGPMDCQLADHDTPSNKAIDLAIHLKRASEKNGARVHLEAHRDTCTETPEKLEEILEGCARNKSDPPLLNFDFSHLSVVKHLKPYQYIDRLLQPFAKPFQDSNLWHLRPFNGHHAQIPITDGKGNHSVEYEEFRPFIVEALKLWLSGPRPTNTFWVNPELGTTIGYNLSCFPDIWEDTVYLARDIERIWSELIER